MEGATHAVAEQRWERTVPLPGYKVYEESEESIAEVKANNGRGENALVVRGGGEVPAPLA